MPELLLEEMQKDIDLIKQEMKAKRRLENINTHEVSLVDAPANGKKFLLHKNLEQGGDLEMEEAKKVETTKKTDAEKVAADPRLKDGFEALEKKGDDAPLNEGLMAIAKAIDSGDTSGLANINPETVFTYQDIMRIEKLKAQIQSKEDVLQSIAPVGKIETPEIRTVTSTEKVDTPETATPSNDVLNKLADGFNKLVEKVESLEKNQPVRRGNGAYLDEQRDGADTPVAQVIKACEEIQEAYAQKQSGNPGTNIARAALGNSKNHKYLS